MKVPLGAGKRKLEQLGCGHCHRVGEYAAMQEPKILSLVKSILIFNGYEERSNSLNVMGKSIKNEEAAPGGKKHHSYCCESEMYHTDSMTLPSLLLNMIPDKPQ